MFINNSFDFNEIKKIVFGSDFYEGREKITVLQKDLLSMQLKKQKCAMKKVICMIHSGYDVSPLFSSIVKIIDTQDVFLKQCVNFYLITYSKENPALLMLTVNTILKDMNDKNFEMKSMAIKTLALLNDGTALEYFINSIKNLSKDPSNKIRARVALSLSNFFYLNRCVFDNMKLIDVLLCLLKDVDLKVYICALHAASEIEQSLKIINNNEIFNYLEKISSFFDEYNNNIAKLGIMAVFKILLNRISDIESKKLIFVAEKILNYLRYNDLQISFLASKILLAIDNNYSNIVFNTMIEFLDSSYEEQFYILDFIREILLKHRDIEYNSSIFAIFSDDPKYIKRKKLEILVLNMNQVAREEIKNLYKDKDFLSISLSCLIENNVLESDVLEYSFEKDQDMAIDILYKNHLSKGIYDTVLEKLFMKANNVSEPYKYIFLCSEFLNTKSKEIERLETLENESVGVSLIKFYISFYIRDIYTKEETKEFIQKIINNKKVCFDRKNLLLEVFEKENSKYFFKEYVQHKFEYSDKDFIVESFPKKKEIIHQNINNDKSNNHDHISKNIPNKSLTLDFPIFKEPSVISEESTTKYKNECLNIKEKYNISNKILNETENEIEVRKIIDKNFSGLIYIRGSSINLKIEKLEKPFLLGFYNESSIKLVNEYVECEKDIQITKMDINSLNEEISLEINGLSSLKLKFTLNMFIEPIEYDIVSFNDNFNTMKEYEILKKNVIDKINAFFVDNNNFCFKIFNYRFFGKIISNQMILKTSDKDMLRFFTSNINEIGF